MKIVNQLFKIHLIAWVVTSAFFLQGCSTAEHLAETLENRDADSNAGLGEMEQSFTQAHDAKHASLHTHQTSEAQCKQESYSLVDLLNSALENNHVSRQAWFVAKQKSASYGMAKSAHFPKVTLSTTAAKEQRAQIRPGLTTQQQTLQPAVAIQYKLFQFGSDQAAIEAAKNELYAANLQFNRSLQTVVYEVQKAYYEFYKAVKTVQVREAHCKDAKIALEATSQKKNAGLVKIQDYFQALYKLEKANYNYKSSLADVENARAALAEAIGIRISNDFQIQIETVHITPSLSEEIEKLIETSIRERHDLKAQGALLKARKEEEKSKERSFWPQVVLGLNSGLQKFEHKDSWQKNYQATVALKWNFFDGLNSTYEILLKRRQHAAQLESYHYTEIKVVSEVWKAFHGLQSSMKQLEATEALVEASEKSYEAIQIGYAAGIKNIADLISEQTDLAEARLFKIQAETNFSLSLAKLAYATGDQPLTH